MTNRDRLISLLGFMADKDSIDGALIDAGIDGTLTYVNTNLSDIRLCAISLMELLLTTPDQTNENGFKVIYDRKAVMERLAILKAEAGLIVDKLVAPKIQNRSYLW